MLPGSDPMGAPASFTARRPNASHLPTFELPPPPSIGYPSSNNASKYGYHSVSAQPPASSLTSVGNLLTPPSNSSADGLSPVSSAATNNNNLPYASSNNTGMWQSSSGTSAAPYGYPSSNGNQQYGSAPARGIFSPSLNSIVRGNGSPSAGELPPPPPQPGYDMHPYSSSMSAPSMPASYSHSMPYQPVPAPVSQASPVNTQDAFSRPPPTPNYFTSATTPQQSSYSYSTGPSPVQQSPMSVSSMSKMSPVNGHGVFPPMNPQAQYAQQHRPYSYPGPVLSNISNPGGHMAMVGPPGMMPGYNSGHAAMQHMYGHPAQHNPQNDRPFRCDQCPQSFNRNHDLKRHKRIHLAVKPFPCGHCDKSFSRKDALKRHILVKGCGKAGASADIKELDGSMSPDSKGSMDTPMMPASA